MKLQSMLAQLQVERQSLSTALSERVQEEANRAKKMTRVMQKGKRSSDDEPQLGAQGADWFQQCCCQSSGLPLVRPQRTARRYARGRRAGPCGTRRAVCRMTTTIFHH